MGFSFTTATYLTLFPAGVLFRGSGDTLIWENIAQNMCVSFHRVSCRSSSDGTDICQAEPRHRSQALPTQNEHVSLLDSITYSNT